MFAEKSGIRSVKALQVIAVDVCVGALMDSTRMFILNLLMFTIVFMVQVRDIFLFVW